MTAPQNLEFYKIKVFLYKYSPPFTPIKISETSNQQIDRYSLPLSEDYFSMYDISDFVATFSFNQTLQENTYSWSLTLRETTMATADFAQNYQVVGKDLEELLINLAQYEVLSRDLATSTNTIKNAKLNRGNISFTDLESRAGIKTPVTITQQGSGTTVTGWEKKLRLSDIIQSYDFISCFLYRGTTPLEAANPGLTASNLRNELTLLSIPGVTPQFHGFVFTKVVTSNAGGVDTIELSGNGVTRLFGATRRLLKADIGGDSIFTAGEATNDAAFTVYGHIYENKTIRSIIADLFKSAYRIKINSEGNNPESLYDMVSLQLGHERGTNLFTIPPYLLALVMKRQGFTYRQLQEGVSVTGLSQQLAQDTQFSSTQAAETFIDTKYVSSYVTVVTDKVPVRFDANLNKLRAYLQQIEEAYTFYNPTTATPYEILDQLKANTFLEFFETSEGAMVIRAPKYNDLTDLVRSSELNIVSTSYQLSPESLITRQKINYGPDIIILDPILAYYVYTNGKLFSQFGWMEAATDKNPNLTPTKLADASTQLKQKVTGGLFEYAAFFLLSYNYSLSRGGVSCGYHPDIQVGRLFFDERNNKVGYIQSVTKNTAVGQAVTMSFTLSYVRDAYELKTLSSDSTQPPSTATTTIVFDRVPELLDVANEFPPELSGRT